MDTSPLLNRSQFACAVVRATKHLVVNNPVVNVTNNELVTVSDNDTVNDAGVAATLIATPAC